MSSGLVYKRELLDQMLFYENRIVAGRDIKEYMMPEKHVLVLGLQIYILDLAMDEAIFAPHFLNNVAELKPRVT